MFGVAKSSCTVYKRKIDYNRKKRVKIALKMTCEALLKLDNNNVTLKKGSG